MDFITERNLTEICTNKQFGYGMVALTLDSIGQNHNYQMLIIVQSNACPTVPTYS